MTTGEKKESIHLFEQIVDGRITYKELMKSLPKDFKEDSDITTLLNMIEHWPAEKTIWGRGNMSESKEHEEMIRDYLSMIVNNF